MCFMVCRGKVFAKSLGGMCFRYHLKLGRLEVSNSFGQDRDTIQLVIISLNINLREPA